MPTVLALAVAALLSAPAVAAPFGRIDCQTAWRERNALAEEIGSILRREVDAGRLTPAERARLRAAQKRREALAVCR